MSSCSYFAPKSQNDVIAMDTLTVDTVCPLYRNYPKPACHLQMRVVVPEESVSPELRQSIVHFLSDLMNYTDDEGNAPADAETLVRGFTQAYLINYMREGKEAIENYDNDTLAVSTWMSYEENLDCQVTYNEGGMVCYRVQTYNYTGGAHGSTSVDCAVYDCQQMRRLHLDDVVGEESLPSVAELMRKSLMERYAVTSVDELVERGFFAPQDIEPTQNFLIDGDGIVWCFDPVTLAPYSEGVIEVAVSWDALYPYISAESPVLALAKEK